MAETSLLCGSCWVNQARACKPELNNPANGRANVEEITARRKSKEECQGKPARGHQGVESENVDDHRRQHGHRQRYVPVGEQKYACNDLKREDHPQVVRGVQGAHELSCDASRRGQRNEVQEAVQAENKKDYARQISCNGGSGSHSPVLLWIGRHSMTPIILLSI